MPQLQDLNIDKWGQGNSMPAGWMYVDDDVLQLERERLFRGTWQYVGPAEWTREPDSYFVSTLDGLSVVIHRTAAGELRCIENACPRCGRELMSGRGREMEIECQNNECSSLGDPDSRWADRVSFDNWGPLLFANSEIGDQSLEQHLEHIRAVGGKRDLQIDKLHLVKETVFTLDANWKLGIENFLECYHCPTAHPSLSDAIDVNLDNAWYERYENASAQGAESKDSGLIADAIAKEDTEMDQSFLLYLFPNLFFSTDPLICELGLVRPIAAQRYELILHYYAVGAISAQSLAERIELDNITVTEDVALQEATARNLAADPGFVGHLLVESEGMLRHFHEMWSREMMRDVVTSPA